MSYYSNYFYVKTKINIDNNGNEETIEQLGNKCFEKTSYQYVKQNYLNVTRNAVPKQMLQPNTNYYKYQLIKITVVMDTRYVKC